MSGSIAAPLGRWERSEKRRRRPQEWLKPYGGSLSDAISLLAEMTGFAVGSIREELDED
mgnify:CR=1 FL=1